MSHANKQWDSMHVLSIVTRVLITTVLRVKFIVNQHNGCNQGSILYTRTITRLS